MYVGNNWMTFGHFLLHTSDWFKNQIYLLWLTVIDKNRFFTCGRGIMSAMQNNLKLGKFKYLIYTDTPTLIRYETFKMDNMSIHTY